MAELTVLDSDVYIQALRNVGRLRQLKRLLLQKGTAMRLASVVALELRAGARTRAQELAVEELIEPYSSRDRVIVPTFDAFLQAGRVLASVGGKGGTSPTTTAWRLTNDALLAAACRAGNATLITGNARDFATIRRYLRGFRFVGVEEALDRA